MRKLLVLIAIAAVTMVSVNAMAAGPLRSLGFQAGYVSPENIDGTWNAGVYLDFGFPVANLYVEPFVNYWNKSESASAGTSGADASLSDWTIGGNLKWVIPTASPLVSPFIGAGMSAHLLKAQSDLVLGGSTTSIDITDNKFGLQLGGGLQVNAGPRWAIVGQGWYSVVDSFNQWNIGGGLQLNL